MELKFTQFYMQPTTQGLWRPIEVEIGFIEDYINQNCITLKEPEMGEWISIDNIIAL